MFGFSKEVLAKAVKKGAGAVKKVKGEIDPKYKLSSKYQDIASNEAAANATMRESGGIYNGSIPQGEDPSMMYPQNRNLPVTGEDAAQLVSADNRNRLIAGGTGVAGLGAMAGNAVGQEQGQQQAVDAMQQQQEQQQQQAMQQAILSSLNAKEGTLSWNALAKNLSQINPELDAITYEEAQMLAQQVSGHLGIPLQVVR